MRAGGPLTRLARLGYNRPLAMMEPNPEIATAFRSLRRALIARRWRRLDPVLRLELAAIALLVSGYVMWRARLPLDQLARMRGAAAAAGALAGGLAACALTGAVLAGADLASRSRCPPAGPEWLALPLAPQTIVHQLAWESHWQALWVLPLGLGLLAAGLGLVPWWALAFLAFAFFALLPGAGRAGTAAARQFAVWRLPRAPAGAQAARSPALPWPAAQPSRAVRLPAARWGLGMTRSILVQELTRSLRATPARARGLSWAALSLLGAAVWTLPLRPAVAGTLSGVLALVAAAALAEWMVALAAGDPYPIVAALPLSARRLWILRVGIAAAGAASVALLLGFAARPLDLSARLQFTGGVAFATLLIGGLGATYGVALFPSTWIAERLILYWLGLALAASVAFPLAGWVVLTGALVHASRRLGTRATLASDLATGEL
jgi:hypothetical protein